jgi:hypothetical protein
MKLLWQPEDSHALFPRLIQFADRAEELPRLDRRLLQDGLPEGVRCEVTDEVMK